MAFEYDFAISYASDSREIALRLTEELAGAGYRVFYDRREEHELTGRDGVAALAAIYAKAARLCILLLSEGYDESAWTIVERDAILGRERIDPTNFVIPVLVRGAPPAWLGEHRLRFDLQSRSMDELLALLRKRAGESRATRAQPELLWRASVGVGTWKNEPIPRGDFVYVASGGTAWNEPDGADGITCLRRDDGSVQWQFRTDADANALLLDNDQLFVGTDAGTIYCVNAADGSQRWASRSRGGPILARPLLVRDRLITFSANGAIQVFDRETGKSVREVLVWSVIAGVVADPIVHGDVIYVVSRGGVVFELPMESPIPSPNADPRTFPQRSVGLSTWSQYQLDGRAPCQFHATPVVLDELLFAPYVRDTYYAGVPVAAIERRRMLERFTIAEAVDAEKTFGNVRARPAVFESLVIVPVAYGSEVVAFDRSGRIRWLQRCGTPYFYQWGSPAVHEEEVLVPRFDGFLHALRAKDGARRWSMDLGGGSTTGMFYAGDEPFEVAGSSWENKRGDSLNAPVSVAGDIAFVHSSGGTLYAIGLPPASGI